MFRQRSVLLALLITGMLTNVVGQTRPDPASLIKSQREAMQRLAMMDGVWRGPAWTILPSGEKHNITQIRVDADG